MYLFGNETKKVLF